MLCGPLKLEICDCGPSAERFAHAWYKFSRGPRIDYNTYHISKYGIEYSYAASTSLEKLRALSPDSAMLETEYATQYTHEQHFFNGLC